MPKKKYNLRPAIDRFLPKTILMQSGCLEWTACLSNKGYGKFCVEGDLITAHRASWEIFIAPIPKGLCVLHRCDNRKCVNPLHLFLGTQLENLEDMWSKDRHRQGDSRGENNNRAKLSESQVYEIKKLYDEGDTIAHISRIFSVNWGTIDRIIKGRGWQHI